MPGREWFSSKSLVRCFVYRLVAAVAVRLSCVPVIESRFECSNRQPADVLMGEKY